MQACEKFLIEEECFWSCEPRLIKWQLVNATIKDVPICGDYCDDWYEACKDDETCTHDWFAGFNYTNGMYTCPRNSKCQTFKEVCTSFKQKSISTEDTFMCWLNSCRYSYISVDVVLVIYY